jgi:hypothetical protein
MPELYCAGCGRPLKIVGPQTFVVRGVEVDLAHCDNPACVEFERTRSYNERAMQPEQLERAWAVVHAVIGK